MAGPHGHHYDDHRMGRCGSDDHRRGMGGGGLRSNGNMWNPEHGYVWICNYMMCSNRSFAWDANSWGMLRGRYELSLAATAVKQYASCIRMSRGQTPQQALHLLQELQLRGLLPNVITYSAAISACEKGQRPQEALQLLQELQLRGLLPDVMRSFRETVASC